MVDNAEAITASGRLINKWTGTRVDGFLNEILGKGTYWIYSDTDSVGGDSIITVNGEKTTIEDYFDSIDGKFLKCDEFNEDYVKQVNGHKTYSVSATGELRENNIRYIMKHRVKKRMYRVTVGDKSVTVTEDHSIMVKRHGKIIATRVDEIDKDDVIISLG